MMPVPAVIEVVDFTFDGVAKDAHRRHDELCIGFDPFPSQAAYQADAGWRDPARARSRFGHETRSPARSRWVPRSVWCVAEAIDALALELEQRAGSTHER
jgi:hypothetical protein